MNVKALTGADIALPLLATSFDAAVERVDIAPGEIGDRRASSGSLLPPSLSRFALS
jgi:hypothetical protein